MIWFRLLSELFAFPAEPLFVIICFRQPFLLCEQSHIDYVRLPWLC